MQKFSYSEKFKPKEIKDPRVKKLLKEIKRPVKAVEVKDLRRGEGKHGPKYVGASVYHARKILVDKDLNKKDKYETIVHEVAHYKVREKNPRFGKKVMSELKKTKMYANYKKQGYQTKKIPEEIFVNYYMNQKTHPSKLNKFKKKFPEATKKFKELMRR